MAESGYILLIKKLQMFIRKYYAFKVIRGALITLGITGSLFLLFSLLEYVGQFSVAVRTVMFYLFILISTLSFSMLLIVPALRLANLTKGITNKEAALIIGKHFNSVKDKLLNIIELKEMSSYSGSRAELILAGIDQKIQDLRPVSFPAAVDLGLTKKYLKYAAPPVIIISLLLLLAPRVLTESTERLIAHGNEFIPVAPFEFVVENSSLEVIRNEDFHLNVKINGDILPNEVFVEFNESQYGLHKESVDEFWYNIRKVNKPLKFRLIADKFYSKEYEISVVPKPVLVNIEASFEFPKYLNKANSKVKNTGDFKVPEGTKVIWNVFTRDSKTVKVNFGDSSLIPVNIGEDRYQFSRRLVNTESYTLQTTNQFVPVGDSVTYIVEVIKDAYPKIIVSMNSDSLKSSNRIFKGKIEDDYGFKGLYFRYLSPSEGNVDQMEWKTQSVKFDRNGNKGFFYHEWNFEDMAVEPGKEVSYYFEIWDNDGVNGSKSSKSQVFKYAAPSKAELKQKRDESNQKIKDDIKNSIKEASELQKEFEKLREKLVDKKKLSWEDKKLIEKMLERQKNLESDMQKISEENNRKMQNEKAMNEASQRILDKQKRLEELFEKLMNEDMKKLYEELQSLLEEMNKDKLQELAEEMSKSNEDLEKELDRSLEVFKQLEFEQKLEDNIEKLKELKSKQEELQKKTGDKGQDLDKTNEEQEKLNKEFEEFQKDMEDLSKQNEELEFKNDMPNTENEQKEISENMKKSSENMKQNKRNPAGENQQKAQDKMEDMKNKMEDLKDELENEAPVESMEDMRQLLDNLLRLSFDQEDLITALHGVDRNDPKYFEIGKKQRKIKDDADMIEDSLLALSKRVPEIEPEVLREMGQINKNIEKSIDLMTERKTADVMARQQLTMTSLNNLALLFDDIIRQMQANISSKKFGDKSCSKPGSQGKPSAGDMRKMQQKLNDHIEKLKKQMEQDKGKNPGGKAGGGQKMSKELSKLAAEQEAIRNELQKLKNQMQENGNEGGKGNLDELSKLMEDTEIDLVNKNISRETLKRQQEILSRLLESEKAEREREFDDKRESKSGKNEEKGNQNDFLEYKRLKERETELLRTVPPAMNQFYRNKVSEYFNDIMD